MSLFKDEIAKQTDLIKGTAHSISLLNQFLKASNIRLGKNTIELDKSIQLNTIHADNITITLTICPETGAKVPEHTHDGIIEYLICSKGSFSVNLGDGYRILKIGACVAVPENTPHTSISLEDNSELVAICIPAEPAYKESTKQLHRR